MYRICLVLLLATVSCARRGDFVADKELTTLGTAEVTAKLIDVQSPFPPNDLYNYAFVMKYRVQTVHRGRVEGNEILVAHYNPLKPRATVQDEFSGTIGGRVDRFRVGDVHRMALEAPVDSFWMGGVIDKYFNEKGERYWAVWTNRAAD